MTASDLTGRRLGHYQIEELIGRGGMGEVYRATDTTKGRVVALKLLSPAIADNPAARDRFLRESRVAAQLNDPHVIPIHDWGEIDGRLFIDMRLVEGRDLRALLAETGPLPAERALTIVGQIADALDAAHRGGLYHRDVKPDNILVDDRDFAYLVDFGLAQADTDTRFTSTGTAIGSFGYMAPERFGDGAIGAPADIYALTCVLFECLAGTHPFGSATTIERLIAAHLTLPPPRLGTAVDDVIARGMAKDPAQRPTSARTLVADAEAALRADPFPGPPMVVPAEGPTVVPPPDTIPAAPTAVTGPGTTPTGPRWDPTMVAVAWPRPTAPQRRSPVLPIVLATVVVLLICAGIVGWAVLSGRSDESTAAVSDTSTLTTARNATTPTPVPPVQATTQPSPPENRVTPPPTTTQAAPSVGSGPGDLGVSVPMSRPACDGTGIVVVGNATSPGSYASEVQAYLDRFPGSNYLRTDQSCPSLRQRSDEGNPIYAVYFVAGPTLGDICTLRNQIGGDAYGKWLDTTSDPSMYITC
ncbi:serine/threonine-protein kinase [Gordonia aurantiaca]|uniref:serine/threonine-protein kinase n=1 Tax=Gordonia sp. B21 TaxID=3151852 RepID=UPI0032663E0B